MLFCVSVGNEGLQYQMLKSYLSALRYAQIARGLPNPFADASFPRLEYVLKVVKKTRAEEGRSQPKPRLPITPVLQEIRSLGNIIAAFIFPRKFYR